eukprot:364151_1
MNTRLKSRSNQSIHSSNRISVKYFIICIIGLQIICILLFFYYINTCKINDDIMSNISINTDEFYEKKKPKTILISQSLPQQQNQTITRNEYIKLSNYRAHLNTDPSQLHFGSINKHSLCGIILKISNINDNN